MQIAMTRWMAVVLPLALVLVSGAEGGKRAGELEVPVRIIVPERDATVHQRLALVSLRGASDEALDRLVLRLNGEDVTWRVLPWGSHHRQGRIARGELPLREGDNTIEAGVRRGETVEIVDALDLRFVPKTMVARIRVVEDGRGIPARVSFHRLPAGAEAGGGDWPELASAADPEARQDVVFGDGSPIEHSLDPGTYLVLATRGPAYSIARAVITPTESDVSFALVRVLDAPEWVAADFHVHSNQSADSKISLRERVRSMRALGVDAIVASDHHCISDYARLLPGEYAWPEDFLAIPGVETGVSGLGHWNVWPLAADDESSEPARHPRCKRSGPLPDSVTRASEIYEHFRRVDADARRERFGEAPPILQINHPRGIQFDPVEGVKRVHDYFNRVAFDPDQPLTAPANARIAQPARAGLLAGIEVDALEILNRVSLPLYEEVRRDWFSLLRQGRVLTGLANSDTHVLGTRKVGITRNWVRVGRARPVTTASLVEAVRRRQVVGSTGPLIEVTPWSDSGDPLGEPLQTLAVRVRAPAWMPVEELRVWLNGELLHQRPLPPLGLDAFSLRVAEWHLELPMAVSGDAFVVVEAGDALKRGQERGGHDGPFATLFPQQPVLAFTNPLRVSSGSAEEGP